MRQPDPVQKTDQNGCENRGVLRSADANHSFNAGDHSAGPLQEGPLLQFLPSLPNNDARPFGGHATRYLTPADATQS